MKLDELLYRMQQTGPVDPLKELQRASSSNAEVLARLSSGIDMPTGSTAPGDPLEKVSFEKLSPEKSCEAKILERLGSALISQTSLRPGITPNLLPMLPGIREGAEGVAEGGSEGGLPKRAFPVFTPPEGGSGGFVPDRVAQTCPQNLAMLRSSSQIPSRFSEEGVELRREASVLVSV